MRRGLLLLLGLWSVPAWAEASGPQDDAAFRKLFASWKHRDEGAARSRRVPLMERRPATRITGVVVTSPEGMRVNPVLGRRMFHAGADLAASSGDAVHATAIGQVVRAGWAGGYGLLVTVRHSGGYETRYGHLSRLSVAAGETVDRGQVIGYVGSTGRSTGPHLHYEVRRDGAVLDPVAFIRR